MTTQPLRTTEYAPGPWIAIVADRMWLIADLDPRDPVLAECWPLVAGAATVAEVLTQVGEAQLRPASSIAIARTGDSGTEILVQGEARADVTGAGSAESGVLALQANSGVARKESVDRFRTITLAVPAVDLDGDAAERPVLMVANGVVPASWVAIHAGPAEASEAPPAARVYDVITAEETGEQFEPASGRFNAILGRTVHPSADPARMKVVPDDWKVGMRQSAAPRPDDLSDATLMPPHTVSEPGLDGDDGSLDRKATVPDAGPAMRNTELDLFGDVSWAAVSGEPSVDPKPYIPPPSSRPSRASHSVPGAGIEAAMTYTVRRPPSTPTTQPNVGAVLCERGHPNPPSRSDCRLCHGGIPEQPTLPIPRPTLGVLRLYAGDITETVKLDRGVIFGRAPGGPEGFGPEEPHRYALPSPDDSISRKHVEVVLQGWLVSVVDLKSTNGTEVVSPDGASEKLPSGGRRVIDDGWCVRLDADTWFRYEVVE